MSEQIWMEDARREAAWDSILAAAPRCADCAQPITEERCLRLDEGAYLCPRCIRCRMVETEGLC